MSLSVDRLLDALMRGADMACQVSTREGFEIKVSTRSDICGVEAGKVLTFPRK
jgi:hypothetical protein